LAVRLVCASALLFLLGFTSLPPMDRDEPRFAQATKQMLESGDFIDIRFQGEARLKKPVGVYWLQAAAVSAGEHLGVADARSRIWFYRLPSLIGALAAVLLTYWAALAFTTRISAYLSALLLGATVLLGVEARLAKTDALLTATIVAEMGALARFYLAQQEGSLGPKISRGTRVVFWGAMAVGILLKGPIAPLVPGLTTALLCFRERSLRLVRALSPLTGLLICAVVAAPWFALIVVKTHGAFLTEAIGKDLVLKVAGSQEMHGAPPGSYLLAFFATGWPAAPFAVVALPFAYRHWRDPIVLFLLAWIVPCWLVFELVPTKLPHYILPLYPGIAILVGVAVGRGALVSQQRWAKAVLLLLPLTALLVPIGVAVAAWRLNLPIPPLWLAAGTGASLVALAAAMLGWRGEMVAAIPTACASALALAAFAYIGVLARPQFDTFALSPRLVETAKAAVGPCEQLAFASSGYAEPSLVFLTATDLLLTDPHTAADFVASGPCHVAFVAKAQEPQFQGALGRNDAVNMVGRVEGINLNGGKRLDIGVYVRQ
jgi:4-amino-4-deoxy-L-arabinose transferase-like glycosyltransferase